MIEKSYITEFVGTALLLAVVCGSGIMGEALSAGNDAVALLGNSIATGAALFVLISLLSPVSGAHFNPCVSVMCWRMRAISGRQCIAYIMAQFAGAIVGVVITHLMFTYPALTLSTKERWGSGMFLSELLSTLILLCVIRLSSTHTPQRTPMMVALTVTGGYWFTASTFFANPAVTFARMFTESFTGIHWQSAVLFITAQISATVLILSFLRREAEAGK